MESTIKINADDLSASKRESEEQVYFVTVAVDTIRNKNNAEILSWLVSHGSLTVNELSELLGASQPRTSQSLSALSKAGVVDGEQCGMFRVYRIRGGLAGIVAKMLDSLTMLGGALL